MVIGKIKPFATIVAQFAAGVEIEAIQHEGRMYLPVVGLGEFSANETAPKKPSKEPAPASDDSHEDSSSKKVYTKEELMDIDSKELVKILKNEFGINPDDYDGKNTNKKLRDLILDAQKNGGPAKEDDDSEDAGSDDTKGSDADDDLINQVADILEDFDAGKKTKKKAISAICGLSDDADEDGVTKLVDEFEEDGEADIEEMAEKIVKVLKGETEKPRRSSPKRSSKKDEDLVEVDDLEVGDRVSVWWDDDNKAWFDGEVKSIKKGKVVIHYDDDSDEVIDPEIHTKIKRLAE